MSHLSNMHDVLEDSIQTDDLVRDKFRVIDHDIIDSEQYSSVMNDISDISRQMNWVKNYDQYPSRKFEYPFAFLSGKVAPEMTVLDAGCSIDPFAPYLASKGSVVYGIDNFASHDVPWDPENGIFKGKYQRFEKAQIYNETLRSRYGFMVDYFDSDMASTPFPGQTFDQIYCVSVLEHLPKWKIPIVFDEWRRLLKPDGDIILTIDYVTNGRKNFNIGRVLHETGFTTSEVFLYPSINSVQNSWVIVAGFITNPAQVDYSASFLSRAYRSNRFVNKTIDVTSTLAGKSARLSGKISRRILLKQF